MSSTILKSSILHVLDTSNSLPILASNPLSGRNEVSDFILDLVEKTFESDDAKDCLFREESKVWEQCDNVKWDLVTISQSIASHIFNVMRRNPDIAPADMLFGVVQINSSDYFFMIKLDYRSAFTHFFNNSGENNEIDIIKYMTLLPNQTAKIRDGFFINMNEPGVKVIETKYLIDGIKDNYISAQVLSCYENKSPRQKATELLKAASKVAEIYYSTEDQIEEHISTTMLDELQEKKPLLVENLGRKFFSGNIVAQQEFFERLTKSEISRDDTLILSEKYQKKFEKKSIRTASGVEIKIPAQIYSNSDEIEFIKNPNGTISLLIKNIKI